MLIDSPISVWLQLEGEDRRSGTMLLTGLPRAGDYLDLPTEIGMLLPRKGLGLVEVVRIVWTDLGLKTASGYVHEPVVIVRPVAPEENPHA